MELTVWTYEGPPHVGAIRVATSMEGVHLALHAPQGDTYADLLFTMIERRARRPAVSYSTFQARDLGGDTAELAKECIRETLARFQPQLLLVGDSCTAELLQDHPGSLAARMGLSVPVVPLELSAYSKKENWGASETLLRSVQTVLAGRAPRAERASRAPGAAARANLLGPTALGFRCRDDVEEVKRLLGSIGVEVGVVAPLGATPMDLLRLPDADVNVCLYPEIARSTCTWLERRFAQPTVKTVPIGLGATREFLHEVARLTGTSTEHALAPGHARSAWYSRSVDSTYLTGKRVFIFGDGTHALAAARIAAEEIGFDVVGLGSYSREFAREVREAAAAHGLEALITDDYLEVEARVAELQPELVLGTQMERHVAKRLGIPCAVISGPAHVQDFPARYSPQMGFEGANVIFDAWIHPLVMGLEEHLLTMFRDDFEFHDRAHPAPRATFPPPAAAPGGPSEEAVVWDNEAQAELQKVPFFVRGKARRNTEQFARQRKLRNITIETLYDAKAHFGR
jgi:light-independent protochlorophyllide reductase subunit B